MKNNLTKELALKRLVDMITGQSSVRAHVELYLVKGKDQ